MPKSVLITKTFLEVSLSQDETIPNEIIVIKQGRKVSYLPKVVHRSGFEPINGKGTDVIRSGT